MSDLPPGWEWTTLSEIAEVRLGRQRSPKNHTGPNMRPYLRAANVSWKGLDLSDVKQMNFSADEVEIYRLQRGDVLLAEASGTPGEVGKPAIWRDEIDDCCFQNTLLRVRAHGPLPEFLAHLFRYEAAIGSFGRAAPGVGIHHLGAQRLSEWHLRLPPIQEQRRIVDAIEEQLSRLDASDGSLRQARKRVEDLRRAAIDFATRGMPCEPLGSMLREPLRNGHSAKRSPNGNIRVFTLTAVTAGDFSERNTKLVSVEVRRAEELWAEPGDIFIERSNTPELVGTAGLYRGPSRFAIFPDLLIRVRVNERCLPEFVGLALQSQSLRRYFQRSAKGIAGSMPKIDQRTILEAPVPTASLDEQREIVERVERELSVLDALSNSVASVVERSKALRRSILDRAFSGRLVPQDPNDEPALVLLEGIRVEREAAPKERRGGRRWASSSAS